MATNRKSFHLRRKDREMASPENIQRAIRDAKVCHLAMVDDGEPYVVPVTYGYEGNALYFHSALDGRKIDIIRKNPRVCFNIVAAAEIVEIPLSCTAKYRSVTGYGTATILTEPQEKVAGLKVLMRHSLGHEVDFPQKGLGRTLVIRIDIEEMTGKQYT